MSGDRVFTIKGKTCTIPKYIVNNLKAFNTSSAFRDSAAYDRSFVNVLLVTLVKVHNLKNSDIEDHVMQFIRGNLYMNARRNVHDRSYPLFKKFKLFSLLNWF